MFKLLFIDDIANAAYCDLSNDNNSIDVNDNADDDDYYTYHRWCNTFKLVYQFSIQKRLVMT